MLNRQQKLIQLYQKCLTSNYTNMTDETQQLKVKVFAMDLGLKYKKIENLFEEAKQAYETDLANQKVEAKQRLEQQAQQEAAAKILQGKIDSAKLILTLIDVDKSDDKILVYRCDDGSVFCRSSDAPNVVYKHLLATAERSVISTYDYQPSKTIYTGATVGGVTTGGFHETKAGYTQTGHKTQKGDFKLLYSIDNLQTKTFTVKKIIAEPVLVELFKHDKKFKEYFYHNSTAICVKDIDPERLSLISRLPDPMKIVEALAFEKDDAKRFYKECKEIADIINRIIRNQLPPTDEELYARAVAYSQELQLNNVKSAIDIFRNINYYKDSQKYLDYLLPEYQKLLQESKEQKVLKKEANKKKRKKVAIIILIIATILTTVTVIGINKISDSFNQANLEAGYSEVNLALEQNEFASAFNILETLQTLEGSEETVVKAKDAIYNKALACLQDLDSTDFSIYTMIEVIENLNGYKDSAKVLAELKQYEEILDPHILSDSEIDDAKELIKDSQYVHKANFETKVLFFDSFCKFDWKYVSGDDKALSVINGTNQSYRTISTNVFRMYGWSGSSVEIWEGSAFGKSGSVADEKYCIVDTKKNIIDNGVQGYQSKFEYNEENGVFTVTETTTDNITISMVLSPDGTLKLTVKGTNGVEKSCTYKKAASYR